MKYEVFVSYASRDRHQVERLVHALRHRGYSVYWDTDCLDAGGCLIEEIRGRIDEASCVVVVWSRLSWKSRWVLFEASCALNAAKLVPVRLEEDVELEEPFAGLSMGSIVGWSGDPASLDARIVRGIDRHVQRERSMGTSLSLYRDLVLRIDSGELAHSFIAPILRRECEHPESIEASESYNWSKFQKEIDAIDDLEQKVDEVAGSKLREHDLAVLAASIAIALAGTMKTSSEALDYLIRVSVAVFAEFGVRLNLSQIEQYDLYRNAFDAGRGAEEFRDDVLAVLKSAAGRD